MPTFPIFISAKKSHTNLSYSPPPPAQGETLSHRHSDSFLLQTRQLNANNTNMSNERQPDTSKGTSVSSLECTW